jgi:hypothetical protein
VELPMLLDERDEGANRPRVEGAGVEVVEDQDGPLIIGCGQQTLVQLSERRPTEDGRFGPAERAREFAVEVVATVDLGRGTDPEDIDLVDRRRGQPSGNQGGLAGSP